MGRFSIDDLAQMASIDLSLPEELRDQEVELRKHSSRVQRQARENAKQERCLICGKECSSFCKSHSVPQFALKRISQDGMVSMTIQDKLMTNEKNIGLGKAGTFFIICNECDSICFQEYETPDNYNEPPNDRMLAQIAMKNYLQMLYKRFGEHELYAILEQEWERNKEFANVKQEIGNLDIQDYRDGYNYAMTSIRKNKADRYHLGYYKLLDYVVPYAAQASMAMIFDLNGDVINYIYNHDERYHLQNIQIAIFPLKKTSVVLAFVEAGKNRYRKFFRQLSKLSQEDQLSVINFIVFSYSENVFINPEIRKVVSENPEFMKVCRLTTNIVSPIPGIDSMRVARRSFDLSNRCKIPDLLSREYALE